MHTESSSRDKLRKRRRIAARLLAAVLGIVAGLFSILVVLPGFRDVGMPLISRERLMDAKETWANANVKSYTVEINVTGPQAAVYRVDVRDGEVVRALRNDQPLANRRTFGTWSVPGMFHTIDADVTNIEKVRNGTAEPFVPQVRIRGKFHPVYGYPERFHRVEMRKMGANPEVTWQVTQFEPIP
jgi:hypothetical protein